MKPEPAMDQEASIFVAGHRGLVGSAITRRLAELGFTNLIQRTRAQLDLRDQAAVERFFSDEQPQYVFLAAAKVGGIVANDTWPADFISQNLQIQTNVIDAAYRHGAAKLCFLGSSCVYPRMAPQPITEDSLLTSELETTNEWYAVAKIAGIKMCQAYTRQYGFNTISLMPTNLYGPGDNFDLESSHVIPALLRKFHQGKLDGDPSVPVWGSGRPRREFLYIDDMADAACFLMQNYNSPEIINVGVGDDVSIAELAATIGQVVGFEGEIAFDPTRPDGTPRKLLDMTKCHQLGWQARTSLADGLRTTYDWYLKNYAAVAA